MVWRFGIVRLALVEFPHSVCLGVVDWLANLACQSLECWECVGAGEELALPLATSVLLLLSHLALAHFDDRLFGRCGVHVALVDCVRHLLPRAPCLEVILLLDGSNDQGRSLGDLGVECFDNALRLGVLDLPGIGPLSVNLVEDILLLAFGVENSRESVLLAGNPALAAIVDARRVSRA